MKRIFTLNFFDAFTTSAISIMLPLLLVSKKIDLGLVGIILSALPLLYMVLRAVLPVFADKTGYKKFYMANAASSILSPLCYLAASGPFLFCAGRLVDSFKSASIWAVNRNSLLESSGKQEAYIKTSRLVALRYVALALGAIGAGAIIYSLGFDLSFALLAVIGAAMLAISWGLKGDSRKGAATFSDVAGSLDFFSKGKLFFKTSMAMMFESSMGTLIAGFVLPIYLAFNGLDYLHVGLVMGGYLAFNASAVFIATKIRQPLPVLGALAAAFYVIPALFLVSLPFSYSIGLLMLMAIGDGIGSVVWEMMIINAVSGSKKLATDIGTLHVPANAGSFIVLVVFGFVVQVAGFAPAFLAAALFHLIFILGSIKLLAKSGKGTYHAASPA